jgi:hypothetical protein
MAMLRPQAKQRVTHPMARLEAIEILAAATVRLGVILTAVLVVQDSDQ